MDNSENRQPTDEEYGKRASTTRSAGQSDRIRPESSIERDCSDEEEDDDDESSSSDDEYIDYGYEYFESQEGALEANLIFFESQDSNSAGEEEIDEDEIDPDELSYEELLALGEFIGQEKRGLSLDAISKCLNPCKFEPDGYILERNEVGTDLCVICQMEYKEGELLVALLCNHSYHSDCVTKWLQINKVCPICSSEVTPPKVC